MIAGIVSRVKNREFILMLALVSIVLGFLFFMIKIEIFGNVPDYATHMGHVGEEQFIYNLTNQDTIKQEFVSPEDFDMVSLHFSDHDLPVQGKTFIMVEDKVSEEVVYYGERENSEIHYGELVELSFDGKGKAGKTYILKLQFEGMGENSLGIFGFKSDENDLPALVNNSKSEYTVAIGTHTFTSCFKHLTALTVLMIIVILLFNVFLVTQTALSEEYLFLGIAIPVGIAFLLFLSVNVVHDGGTHLAKVYHYSNVLLGRSADDSYGYVMLQKDEADAFDEIYQDYHRELKTAQMYWDTLEEFGTNASDNYLVQSHEYRETSASSVWEYFPGVIGMTIGRLMGGSARFNILLAKILFFVFYVGMVFTAIRITPYFKSVIAFVALLPMSLYQATGITYDVVVLAVSLVILALFFKARIDMLQKKDILLLFVLSAILGCCKGGFYLVLLIAFIIVPEENVRGRKGKWCICFGSILVGGICMLLTSLNTYLPVFLDIFRRTEVSSPFIEIGSSSVARAVEMVPRTDIASYGISYAFYNIAGFFKLMIATLLEKMEFYVGGLVGYRMAWTDETVGWLIQFVFLILLVMASSKIKGKTVRVSITLTDRLVCLFLFGIEVIGFHLLMLIETPVGAMVINGVQGRYFLAWVPVVLFIIYNGRREYEVVGIRRLFIYYSIAESIYLYYFLKIFLGIA